MAMEKSKNTDLIIKTAVELFRREGYSSVSINEICKCAGLTRSSFYLVFSSKKDIILYILSTVRSDLSNTLNDFVNAPNDFERMWSLCDRYLMIAQEFGSVLTGTLLSLELEDPIGIYDLCHSTDDWLITLARNCQRDGIIRNKMDAAKLTPMATDLIFLLTYNWCREKGGFNLRRCAREKIETVFDVAEKYRQSKAAQY